MLNAVARAWGDDGGVTSKGLVVGIRKGKLDTPSWKQSPLGNKGIPRTHPMLSKYEFKIWDIHTQTALEFVLFVIVLSTRRTDRTRVSDSRHRLHSSSGLLLLIN
jgi:hypothetical protein